MKGSYLYENLLKYIAEFLGTLFFLHMILATDSVLLIVGSLALSIFVFGPFSGGHFNPAVTVMMAFSNKLKWADVAPYITAQIAGGLAAIQLHKLHLYIVAEKPVKK